MATQTQIRAEGTMVPITGRQLRLPDGPIFHLHRADQSAHELGEFRAWAGYKNFGSDKATDNLAHFQHVLSFSTTEDGGRTGVHAHLAHAHIVIPTSGRALFSYDGVVTEAAPGCVIVQHGGTVHDQFQYTYAATSEADNRQTPQTIEPSPPDAAPRSFGFLELFVPRSFANVEIVAPQAVSATDQCTAWDHPYHTDGARFSIQHADAPDAAYRPVAGRPDIEARDTGTWEPTARMVATWFIRPAAARASRPTPIDIEIAGEEAGVDIHYMINGSARFLRKDGQEVHLEEGDTLTCSQGLVGHPYACSSDMRLIRMFIAAKTQLLRERTPDEIRWIEDLGARIVTRSEARGEGDRRPVNCFRAPAES